VIGRIGLVGGGEEMKEEITEGCNDLVTGRGLEMGGLESSNLCSCLKSPNRYTPMQIPLNAAKTMVSPIHIPGNAAKRAHLP